MALADKEMVSILNCTRDKGRSACNIIRESALAHTTAYRKIKWLVDRKLLAVERVCIDNDGKKYSLFRSTIRSVIVNYKDCKISIAIEQNIKDLDQDNERVNVVWQQI